MPPKKKSVKAKNKSKSKSKSKSKNSKKVRNRPSKKSFTKKYVQNVIDDVEKYGKKVKIDELVRFLAHCSDKYYNSETEVVSDDVFDSLMDILEKRDPDNPFLDQIGAPVSNKDKVKLPYPMSSLDKIKPGDKKIKRWEDKYPGPYVLSDKLDGISIQIIRDKKGKVSLYTRGDATEGKDISHLTSYLVNDDTLKNLPKGTSLRGELILLKEKFKKYESEFAHPRGAMAGLVTADNYEFDSSLAKDADLVIYGMIYPSSKTYSEKMKEIKAMGFNTVWYEELKELEDDETLEKILIDRLITRRTESEYNIDGIVCVDSSTAYIDKATKPKHAFAFKMKFADQIEETIVEDIEWEPTMYGYIQPTVIVKEVKIGGCKITRATGHNAKYIKENKIGKGAKIKLIKSGDIIPYILEVIKPAKKPLMPSIKYKWHKNGYEVLVGKLTNDLALKIGIKRTTHFFKTLKIKYISEGIISKLYNNGYNTIFKILDGNEEEMSEIDGIGTKLVNKIFSEVKKKMPNIKLHVLMASSLRFGRGLGVKKLKLITDEYPDILHKKFKDDDDLYQEIIDLDGFSDITSQQFVDNFDDFKDFIKKLDKYVDIKHLTKKESKKKSKDKNVNSTNKYNFADEKIVFTGFRNDDWENIINDNGGKVTTSVSKNTTLLVYVLAPGKDKPSKLKKAEDLGIEMTTKDEFKKKYNLP